MAITHQRKPRAKLLFAVGLLVELIAAWRAVAFYKLNPDGSHRKES